MAPEEFKQSTYQVILVEGTDREKTSQEFETIINRVGEDGLPIVSANLSTIRDPHTGDTTYLYFALVETKAVIKMIPTQADLEKRTW